MSAPGGRRQRTVTVERYALAQTGQRVFVRSSSDARLICAFDAVPRVSEPRGEVAVVGEEQQALAVVVEPADGVDVLANAAEQIHDGAAPLRIGARCHVALGLVEQDVAEARGGSNAAAVDANVVGRG